MRERTQARPSGFTLIELMVSVGIVGILASVALPSFVRYQLRAKAAERTVFVGAISQAINTMVTSDTLPHPFTGSPNIGYAFGTWNPPYPAAGQGTTRRLFNPTLAGWKTLDARMLSSAYYSYMFYVREAGGQTASYIWVQGDLDGDGRYYSKTYYYYRKGASPLQLTAESPLPGSPLDQLF